MTAPFDASAFDIPPKVNITMIASIESCWEFNADRLVPPIASDAQRDAVMRGLVTGFMMAAGFTRGVFNEVARGRRTMEEGKAWTDARFEEGARLLRVLDGRVRERHKEVIKRYFEEHPDHAGLPISEDIQGFKEMETVDHIAGFALSGEELGMSSDTISKLMVELSNDGTINALITQAIKARGRRPEWSQQVGATPPPTGTGEDQKP